MTHDKKLLILVHPDCIAEVGESATSQYDSLLKNHLGRFDYVITHLFWPKHYTDSLQKDKLERYNQIQKIRSTVSGASNEVIESENEKCSYSKNIPDYLIMNPGVTVYMAGGYEDNCLWFSYIRLFRNLHDVLREANHEVFWYRPLIFQDNGHAFAGTKPYDDADPEAIRMDRKNPEHILDFGPSSKFHPDKVNYKETANSMLDRRMKTFLEWLNEDAADDIRHVMNGIAKGVGPAADKKVEEYAKRIIGGEAPEDVLQGLKPSGAMWNSVMSKVQELKGSGRVSLSDLAGGVADIDWHKLYEIFARQHERHPEDPSVGQLGMALYQSAKTGDYEILNPFRQKYIWAQPLR